MIVVLALPFLAGSWPVLKSGFLNVFKRPKFLALGLGTFLLIVAVQLYVWYLQTGDWLVYSYQNESFDFANPHFIEILFSYKKGLFVYTPIAFLAFVSITWFIKKEKRFIFWTWLLFFVLVTYILSSWWSWFYGCSFGLRAYIDFYGLIFS